MTSQRVLLHNPLLILCTPGTFITEYIHFYSIISEIIYTYISLYGSKN